MAHEEGLLKKKLWVTNLTKEDAYVIASERPGYLLADLFLDATLMALGVEELRGVAVGADIPDAIKTLQDLWKVAKVAWAVTAGPLAAIGRPIEGTVQIIEWFKNNSILIKPGQTKDVYDTGYSDYLTVSGWAGLLGADTINLMVSCKGRTVRMNCGNDDDLAITKGGLRKQLTKWDPIWVPHKGYCQTGKDWSNRIDEWHHTTVDSATKHANDHPKITFMVFSKKTTVFNGPPKIVLKPDRAYFFKGTPTLGTAPDCDTYVKT
mmetsp:Transcript_21519/g.24019  ORF Transcript_21519/g.24019 Transcript_21519/m.24019 type:complete len:264 (-) Transcript_21519:53-844(-)